MEQAPEVVNRIKSKIFLTQGEKESVDMLITASSKNKICLKQDKQLAERAALVLDKKISAFAIARRRNKLGISPWRGNAIKMMKPMKKRAYTKHTTGSIENVLAMNTAKILKVLNKIARKLHAI